MRKPYQENWLYHAISYQYPVPIGHPHPFTLTEPRLFPILTVLSHSFYSASPSGPPTTNTHLLLARFLHTHCSTHETSHLVFLSCLSFSLALAVTFSYLTLSGVIIGAWPSLLSCALIIIKLADSKKLRRTDCTLDDRSRIQKDSGKKERECEIRKTRFNNNKKSGSLHLG